MKIDNYDYIITGSDQVWNKNIIGEDNIDFYTLNFPNIAKKISFSASCGSVKYINDKIIDNIKKIDCISVRENELEKYLNSALSNQIITTLDPVFLLSKEEWESNMKLEDIIQEKYILTYSIGDKSDEVRKIANRIAKENKCKIVHIDDSLKYGVNSISYSDASPQEFLSLIMHADVVVASSFHAVAFSIIFNKKLVVVPNTTTRSRMDNILEIVNAKNVVFNNFNEFDSMIFKNSSYNYDLLEKEKEKTIDFLINSIQ